MKPLSLLLILMVSGCAHRHIPGYYYSDELTKDEKPQYANLRKDQDLETVTLHDALELFELPKSLGKYKDSDVSVAIGKFGPFIKLEEKYISIPRDIDPYSINLEKATELIHERERADRPIGTYKDLPITKGAGKFGPFVKWNGLYASISKKSGFTVSSITEKEAIELIKSKEKKEAEKNIKIWEGEKVSILKGRWGPFIKLHNSKAFFRLPLNSEGKKMSAEEAKNLSLEVVKKTVAEQGGKIK